MLRLLGNIFYAGVFSVLKRDCRRSCHSLHHGYVVPLHSQAAAGQLSGQCCAVSIHWGCHWAYFGRYFAADFQLAYVIFGEFTVGSDCVVGRPKKYTGGNGQSGRQL